MLVFKHNILIIMRARKNICFSLRNTITGNHFFLKGFLILYGVEFNRFNADSIIGPYFTCNQLSLRGIANAFYPDMPMSILVQQSS